MNKKTSLFIEAANAALKVPIDANEHTLATARLDSFKAAAADPRDYDFFAMEFDMIRNRMAMHARTPLRSEVEAKHVAAAAAPVG